MKKIVCIGPESTGKSTLCEQLSKHYETSWCPEYAREYLTEIKRPYHFNDLLNMARGQLQLEETYRQRATGKFYFIDTDMYVMKVWCEEAFDNCHTWILKQAAQKHYDMYLLCDVDLPWVADDLREYPQLEKRQRLYKMYKDIVVNSGVPWAEISGAVDERFACAVRLLDNRFPS